MVAIGGPCGSGTGASRRKLSFFSCWASNCSTRWRRASSPAQAASRYAERAVGSACCKASMNMSRSRMARLCQSVRRNHRIAQKKSEVFSKGSDGLLDFDFPAEPCPGEGPEKVSLTRGHSEHFRSLRARQAGKVAELNEVHGQRVQSTVQCNQAFIDFGRHNRRRIEFDAFSAPTVFGARAPSGVLDQNAPHGLCCGGKEMAAAVPSLGLFDID